MVLQQYFSNLIICIILEAKECKLITQEVKKKQVIKTFQTLFENPNEDKLDDKIIAFLEQKRKEYCDIYITILANSSGQGAIHGTEAKDFNLHSVDTKNILKISVDEKWSAYISHIDFKWLKGIFEPFDIDLMYSPFVLLNHCLQEEKPTNIPTLYIYNQKDSFAIAVFENGVLEFGEFFKTQQNPIANELQFSQDWSEAEEEEGLEHLIDEENTEEESIEEYESLDDLDDELNADFDNEDFLNEEIGTDFEDENSGNPEDSISSLSKDMLMYEYLTKAIHDFYNDSIKQRDFISDIVIFDNDELSDTFIRMIQDELFMTVNIKHVDTLKLMSDMAKRDLGL